MNQLITCVLAATAVSLVACSATPHLDAHFGESVNILKAQQTINPDASRNTNPVAGVDGKAAKGALDNYRDSFRKPPAESANVLTIGVGSGK